MRLFKPNQVRFLKLTTTRFAIGGATVAFAVLMLAGCSTPSDWSSQVSPRSSSDVTDTNTPSMSATTNAASLAATNAAVTTPIAAEPVVAVASKSDETNVIILREGDQIRITIADSENLDSTQPIRRDGKINMQLIGDVQASGLSPEDLQKEIHQLYRPQIGEKDVTVTLISSSFPVFVTGAVVKPGKILSDHPMTALEAVMEAGGFDTATANMSAVRIIRNENGSMKHFTVNLKRVLDGNDSSAFYLKPGDILYVPERFEMF